MSMERDRLHRIIDEIPGGELRGEQRTHPIL